MFTKLENGEILAKCINSHEDIDDELVGHPDSIYNSSDQIERIKWLMRYNMKKPIMEVGTACGYVLNKLDGDIGIDIMPDRLLNTTKDINAPPAKDGSYLVLENPAKDDRRPKQGANGMEELDHGRKVNIRGHVTFPLWAGQIAKVIQRNI